MGCDWGLPGEVLGCLQQLPCTTVEMLAEEMAQKLSATFVEEPGLVPSPHLEANDHLCLQFQGIQCLLASSGTACVWCKDKPTSKALRHIQ